ncbi:MAG: amidohydrolase [Rhodospirillaceae bacterium]|nr:amidohydrolase [Rhodospirillaceae bacterium]MYB11679.1 amidohydrolase [Rhodospirillaceae bacterium]MYI49725.1 amidohydrolase [Rhodospirillaceae bacterium]
MSSEITIFSAKKIITMCRSRPEADHVAVRDGRILGAGSLSELEGWGDYTLDRRFADSVVMPGFVEGHSHILEGALWRYVYVGFFDRTAPDGRVWPGLRSIDEVVARLRDQASRPELAGKPVVGWGFDPIYFSSRRMIAADLDRVTDDRPTIVMHASGHMLNANSFILEAAGITADTNVHGIVKDENGLPTGELQELAAMFIGFEVAGINPFEEMGSAQSIRDFAAVAQRAGVTTATDLYAVLYPENVEQLLAVTGEDTCPIRLVPAYGALSGPTDEGVELMGNLTARSTDKLRFGLVKMMTDGSIQGFTARLKWPGYFNGAPNGIWNASPEELKAQFAAYHRAGFQIHIHTNGDEAIEVMLDAIEAALDAHPRRDHRHTLQHCQMASEAQLERAAALGVCVNMFANHIYYWGDEHLGTTLGPERAHRLEPFATAERLGVRYAMHSDAPVSPIGPLFTAWCAAERKTATGRVLGQEERLSVDRALRAITLGAAYTLKMDHLVGSIESGKFADFAVLEEDPLSVSPSALRDIPIRATMLGGREFPAH